MQKILPHQFVVSSAKIYDRVRTKSIVRRKSHWLKWFLDPDNPALQEELIKEMQDTLPHIVD